MRAAFLSLVMLLLLAVSIPARALDAEVVRKLAFGESDEQVAAVAALVAEGDAQAAALLQALADGELQTAGKQVLIVKGDSGIDAVTGQKVAPLPGEREDVSANNRLRRELATALAALSSCRPIAQCGLPRQKNFRAVLKMPCCRCSRRHWQRK